MTDTDENDPDGETTAEVGWWLRMRPWIIAILLFSYAGWESLRAPNLQQRRALASNNGSAVPLRDSTGTAAAVRKPQDPNSDLDMSLTEVDWIMLSTLNLRTGSAPNPLDTLNTKTVRILGFVLPLDDLTEETATFLLVPYVGACVHTPPPPPNQLVQVVMRSDTKVPVSWWTPVYIEGVLHIEQVDSPYGKASFRMDGVRAIDYERKRVIRPSALN